MTFVQTFATLKPAAAADQYDLMIDGDIGASWWNDETITAKKVVAQLKALPSSVKQINIRINSFGGAVSDGLAIYNALRESKCSKVAIVDGVAISCGSLIAMAADEIRMPATSMMMIHAPWGGASGNAKELRQTADVLDKFASAMADAYIRKTGKPRSEIEAMLTDGQDHWFTGTEAVDQGFADTLIEDGVESASARYVNSAPEPFKWATMAAFARMKKVQMEDENPTAPTPVEPQAAAPVVTEVDPLEAVRAALQAEFNAKLQEAEAKVQAAEAALAAQVEAREVQAAIESARSAFQFIPGRAEDIGPALRTVAKAAPAAHAVLVDALRAANGLLSNANTAQMAPVGSSKSEGTESAAQTLERLARAKLASQEAPTIEQARAMVYIENKELVAAIRAEQE